MSMRAVLAIFLALFVGIAALPAVACELGQSERASYPTVTAFLAEHGRAAKSAPSRQLVACQANGGPCSADSDCCSGACKPLAEGRACVPK